MIWSSQKPGLERAQTHCLSLSACDQEEAKGSESQRVGLRSEVTPVWGREEAQHQAVRWLCLASLLLASYFTLNFT